MADLKTFYREKNYFHAKLHQKIICNEWTGPLNQVDILSKHWGGVLKYGHSTKDHCFFGTHVQKL